MREAALCLELDVQRRTGRIGGICCESSKQRSHGHGSRLRNAPAASENVPDCQRQVIDSRTGISMARVGLHRCVAISKLPLIVEANAGRGGNETDWGARTGHRRHHTELWLRIRCNDRGAEYPDRGTPEVVGCGEFHGVGPRLGVHVRGIFQGGNASIPKFPEPPNDLSAAQQAGSLLKGHAQRGTALGGRVGQNLRQKL